MKRNYTIALLTLLLAGCSDDPTAPLEARVFSILGGLEVGEALTLRGADAEDIFLPGGERGAEYVVVPFFASNSGEATLALQIEGADVREAIGPPNPVQLPTATLRLATQRMPPRDERFHLRLRQWEAQNLMPRLQSRSFAPSQVLRNMTSRAAVVPQAGELLTIRVPTNASNLCENPELRTARVVAVTDRAIVLDDTENPADGFTDAEFRRIGEEFDDLVYPVNARNFGEPTDIDDNSRVLLFFTSAVNALTPPNSSTFTVGFTFLGDLLPREPEANVPLFCPASNEAEIFYLLAPDPLGEINQNPRPTEDVALGSTGVVGHEFQHLINFGRRLYVLETTEFEEFWLNEALSHVAEELLFYAAVPSLQPRQNLDLDDLTSSDPVIDALLRYQIDNLVRYAIYIQNPDEESLLAQDRFPTRGASWAFLRYAADYAAEEVGVTNEDFFFDLVNATSSGIKNLNDVLDDHSIEVSATDLMQNWTVSVYADDAGLRDLAPIYRQPSWNFRDILSRLFVGIEEYPLAIRPLGADGSVSVTLRGGGAAFVRFGVNESTQASIATTSGGTTPPGGLRISVIRTR